MNSTYIKKGTDIFIDIDNVYDTYKLVLIEFFLIYTNGRKIIFIPQWDDVIFLF